MHLGDWEPATRAEASSWLEASGALAWALGRLPEMAPEYEPFARSAVEAALGLLQPTLGLLTRASLRPLPRLERQLSSTRLWIWRAETHQAERSGHTPPAGYTFPEIIALTAELHYMQRELPKPVEQDFGVAGRPYRELPAGRVARLHALARARAAALAWLCGQAGPPGS